MPEQPPAQPYRQVCKTKPATKRAPSGNLAGTLNREAFAESLKTEAGSAAVQLRVNQKKALDSLFM
jgi:hypothetical protein